MFPFFRFSSTGRIQWLKVRLRYPARGESTYVLSRSYNRLPLPRYLARGKGALQLPVDRYGKFALYMNKIELRLRVLSF